MKFRNAVLAVILFLMSCPSWALELYNDQSKALSPSLASPVTNTPVVFNPAEINTAANASIALGKSKVEYFEMDQTVLAVGKTFKGTSLRLTHSSVNGDGTMNVFDHSNYGSYGYESKTDISANWTELAAAHKWGKFTAGIAWVANDDTKSSAKYVNWSESPGYSYESTGTSRYTSETNSEMRYGLLYEVKPESVVGIVVANESGSSRSTWVNDSPDYGVGSVKGGPGGGSDTTSNDNDYSIRTTTLTWSQRLNPTLTMKAALQHGEIKSSIFDPAEMSEEMKTKIKRTSIVLTKDCGKGLKISGGTIGGGTLVGASWTKGSWSTGFQYSEDSLKDIYVSKSKSTYFWGKYQF